MPVTTGTVVSVEYTLRLEDQQVFESNVGSEPLTYTHGANEIIPGLETALEGMELGERKQVTVSPTEGYGPLHPEGFFEVEKTRIPAEALTIGAQLQGTGPDGKPVYPRVSAINETTVVLDLNHPLAGKTLYFDVKVVNIAPPPSPTS